MGRLGGSKVNEERHPRDDASSEADAESQAPAGDGLSESEKERIRSEEIHSAKERNYREEVRREVRREAGGGSTWSRVLAMLKLEPGISETIASDPKSTKQGLVVLVIASAAACLLFLPLVLVTIPFTLIAIAVTAGLYCLFSRLFANEVPAYPNWFRMLLFTSAPTALGIVPFVGTLAGSVYTIVLHVVAIRDLARVTTGAAVVVWLISILLPTILVVAAALTFGLAAFMQYLPDMFDW